MSPDPRPSAHGRRTKPEFLRGRNRFRDVFLRGTRISGKHIGCVYLMRDEPSAPRARVAFVVSSPSMNAVARNRFRRLMREACRRIALPHGHGEKNVDIIFTPESGWKTIPSYEEIRSDVDRLVREIQASLTQRQ